MPRDVTCAGASCRVDVADEALLCAGLLPSSRPLPDVAEPLIKARRPSDEAVGGASSDGRRVHSPWAVGLTASGAYALTYFWRYPIFLLPPAFLSTHVATLGGKPLDLQSCFSLAFTLGFGAAKLPAMRLVSSPAFYRARLSLIFALQLASMLAVGAGVACFARRPQLLVACVFVSSFLSSFLFGAILTYLEGRETTELLLAITQAGLIVAGSASRGLAAAVVAHTPLPARLMPLAIGLLACPLSMALVAATHRAPPPSPADIALRSSRAPLSPARQLRFLRAYCPGIATLFGAYAVMVALRAYRDFYSQQIFSAALGGARPPSYFYLVDLPAAFVSCAVLAAHARFRDSRAALTSFLVLIAAGVALAAAATLAFHARLLGALSWQLLYSALFYLAFALIGAPAFDRLIAATRTDGTCTFLVFANDLAGYVGTVALLLYQSLGPLSAADDALRLFFRLVYAAAPLVVALLAASLAYWHWVFGRGARGGGDLLT